MMSVYAVGMQYKFNMKTSTVEADGSSWVLIL